jgi:hypothetical protein
MGTLFGFRYVGHFKKIAVSGQRNGTIMENVLTHIKVYSCIKSIYTIYCTSSVDVYVNTVHSATC